MQKISLDPLVTYINWHYPSDFPCQQDVVVAILLQEGETSLSPLVTYVDWYTTSDFPCEYDDVVANLKKINILHFILVINPESR